MSFTAMPSGFDITGGGTGLLYCISAHPSRHRAPAVMEAALMKVRREIRFLWSFFVVLVSPDMFILLASHIREPPVGAAGQPQLTAVTSPRSSSSHLYRCPSLPT